MKKWLRKMRKMKIGRRIVSVAMMLALVFGAFPVDMLSLDIREIIVPIVHADNTPRREHLTYNDLNDFVTYSIAYQSNAASYCEDVITLTINSGEYHTLSEDFISLGTESYPFNGKIYITTTNYGESWYFDTDKPLFNYVTDSVTINYSYEDHNTEPVPIEIRRKFVDSTLAVVLSPLFANHVVHTEGASAVWSIKASPYVNDENVNTYNFSGLIGTMESDAKVSITFVNDSYYASQSIHSDIMGASDIGLICGTMNQGSSIDLTLSGTNTYCDVESTTSGNAGGLVGTMHAGSVLTLHNDAYVPDSGRTIKATSGYAGGLVGKSDGGLIQFPTSGEGGTAVCTSITGTVEGTTGAGGLYGYYSNPVTVSGENQTPQTVTFDMKNYDIDCTVKATAAGGLFGALHSTANITIDGSDSDANEITVVGDTVTNFGGISGTYSASALANELSVVSVTANTEASLTGTSYYGGVTGLINGSEAAFLRTNSFTHKSSTGYDSATSFGGVVGNAGEQGSMLDMGTVTIETGSGANGQEYHGGGIVGVLNAGVLRLSGTTNLSKAPSMAVDENYDCGQLVGVRKDALVYAVGTGSDSGWTFVRSNTDVYADDIGTWGCVIRPDATNLPLASLESTDGTGVLDYDSTNHTVTVASPVTTITSGVDYTKTALNMQLNSGDAGALKFADNTNTKDVLLGTNLTFSGTINLSGTGNIGLTRDDYKDDVSEIGEYTGAISGGTVNLAIGERYAYSGASPVGRGAIIAHRYNGLIARTGSNSGTSASFSNMTIGGTITVNGKVTRNNDNKASMWIGGAVAQANDGIVLSSVVSSETIDYSGHNDFNPLIGGLVGNVKDGSKKDVTISGVTAGATINLVGGLGTDSGHSAGGVLGRISATAAFQINISSTTIGTTITTPSQTDVSASGLIADIVNSNNTRTMNLTGVTVSGTSITNNATSHAGGLLGMRWLATDVNFTVENGVIVSGTNTLSTTADYAAGLVQQATGHWTVPKKGISISGLTISDASNSLGLLVHDGYHKVDNNTTKGLYLELTNKDSYDLQTGLTIPSATNYDELVRSTGADILSNGGKGIISITTDGDLVMNGTGCNTYQNKYNQGNLTNNKSRYYYNLTSISGKANPSDGEKLLLWSLNKYAASNLRGYFTDSLGTTITGTFDLEHISYYPIDLSSDITIGNATFRFYNNEIEASEGGTGNSDGGVRTTRGSSQHYLMHSGVFKNVSSTVTTNGNIHFKGSVGVDSTYSGVLINGTLSGTLTASSEKEIVLEGVTISDTSRYLLINKLTTNSKMTLSGVRAGGGKDFSNADKSSSETQYASGATVASSLIGDVSGNGVQVEFSRMKLDSRTTAGSPVDLSAQYGTTKSIFSGATFINKFAVDNNSTGIYNFDENLDWDNGTHNANVTYGLEIKTSKEYENKQEKYFDQTHFVDPADPSLSRTTVYPFDSGFLPYIKESTAIRDENNYTVSMYSTRELAVNVSVTGLTVGCGTYNHPYEITLGSQLVAVAAMTSNNIANWPQTLRLPIATVNSDATLNSVISSHWCEDKEECAEFTLSGTSYKYTANGTTYTWSQTYVRHYLLSAYYIIKKDIYIEAGDNYPGLGAPGSDGSSGKYAFRGVIVGSKSDGSIKITNRSKRKDINYTESSTSYTSANTMGLITMSNGCVIKDLTIVVEPNDTVNTSSNDKYNYKVADNVAYAYNEYFPNYGAVINKVMGGDNIIDNVKVEYQSGFSFKVLDNNDYKATVGGYVGCVVNGGLVFRNVTDDSLTNFTVKKVDSNGNVKNVNCNGKTITNLTDGNDLIHIHVNPFVGRVINGYVVRETDSYGFSEDGATYGDGETRTGAVEVTMHNTRKNYSIPDIDSSKNYQNDVANGTTNVLTFSKETGETTYNTITVPSSQALYIMSIIAQSGSGCATGDNEDYTYNISYCGSNTRNYTGNTADNNKATHWASYSNVGTATSTSDPDYELSANDKVNNRKSVPYIIYKYTSAYISGDATYYPARTLTQRTFYINLVGGTTYYLPDSFRGIGFLGSNTLDDNLKIYGFNGNGTTENATVIDVNAEYFLNKKDNDPYFNKNIKAEYMVGIGLFNNLKQSSSTGFDRKYEQNAKYQITNFTLQGYLSAHHVNSNGADENANPSNNRDPNTMNTAGFVPTVLFNDVTLYNFSNILFKNLHINSFAYAAGFVAYANGLSNNTDYGVMIYINNCNADGFRIDGSGRIAGFVGSYDTNYLDTGIHINTGLDSSGKDSFTSVMRNTIINNKLSTNVKHNYTAGILGSVYFAKTNNNNLPADNGDNARGHLILRNVTIEGGNAETNYIGNKNNPSGSSGGIIGGGSTKVNGCLIQNCTVKDIDIYGRYAGGIMGENANRNSDSSRTGTRIVGCTVIGKLDENDNPQYTIMGLYYSGGVYGDTRDTNNSIHPKYKSVTAGDSDYVEYKTDIDGIYVYGYKIFSANTDQADNAFNTNNGNLQTRVAAGGIVGSNNENRYIQNCKVEKCVIDVGTGSSTANNTPCGGIVGQMNTGTLYGYNIEVKDCDFLTHQWANGAATNTQKAYAHTDGTGTHNPVTGMKCGNFIGNVNSKAVYLTAIHSENNPASLDFNGTELSSSFIVYADYLDAASGNDHGTAMSSLKSLTHSVTKNGVTTTTTYTETGEGGLMEYFPHVNVSPVVSMGSSAFLTSDGAALYDKLGTKVPAMDAIVSDGKYLKPGSVAKSALESALSADDDANRISTYHTEMGSLPDGVDDFAVVVINTENWANSTSIINYYIQMATNTNTSYVQDDAQKYIINVYPCTYDSVSGNYVINASGKTAGLNYSADSKQFYMANGYADSNQGDYQFSLIDVQFLKPAATNQTTNPTEIVYHLYVPVLTRKMMRFGFKSASLSGTDIILDKFTNYGNTLAESLESWYTGYIHYTYPISELQNLLDNGTGFNWNSSKIIQLKYTTSSVSAKLGSGTQFVLVDPYHSDQYYYATLQGLRPDSDTNADIDNLKLAEFNTKLDGTGNSFSPATIADLMNLQGFTITAVSGTAGAQGYLYKVTEDSSNAKITIGGVMYEYVGEGSTGNVKITVNAPTTAEMTTGDHPEAVLREDYYLCVRAYGNGVYNYSIRTPVTISGVGIPAIRVLNLNENEITNVIMGNLYDQTVSIAVKNNNTDSLVIDETNHRLDVTLTSKIQLLGTADDKEFIISHLNSGSINLYHAFVLTLTAKYPTYDRVDIYGEPDITATFTVDNNTIPGQLILDDYTGDYILLTEHDIRSYLKKNTPTTLSATVHIDFNEEVKYNLEFPDQDGSENQIGVNVSARSNLAYDSQSLLYTNMTQAPGSPSPNYYYVKKSENAKLVYNFKTPILDEYDEAGASSFNYSQQGVNPKNFIDPELTRIPMDTVATYDATNVKRSEFEKADKIRYKLVLYKKVGADGSVEYQKVTNIGDYIDLTVDNSIFIKVNSGVSAAYYSGAKMTNSNGELSYVAELNQAAFGSQDDQILDANILFTVITGEGFKEYSNYKFVLTVDLLKNDDTVVNSATEAKDWVVYTNAKINPHMLTYGESGE